MSLTLVSQGGQCTQCGGNHCDCWYRCDHCGVNKFRHSPCPNQASHAKIFAAETRCVCERPYARRRVCADVRGNKSPCGCYCHHGDNREARVLLGFVDDK